MRRYAHLSSSRLHPAAYTRTPSGARSVKHSQTASAEAKITACEHGWSRRHESRDGDFPFFHARISQMRRVDAVAHGENSRNPNSIFLWASSERPELSNLRDLMDEKRAPCKKTWLLSEGDEPRSVASLYARRLMVGAVREP